MAYRKFFYVLFLVTLISVFSHTSGSVFAADIVVIGSKDLAINSLTKEEVKNIFLGVTTKWPDKRKIYFVTMKGSDAHKVFLKKYIRKSPSQFRAFWKKKLFTGKGKMPKMLNTEQEIVDYLAQTDGAIGYVSSATPMDNFKVITVSE